MSDVQDRSQDDRRVPGRLSGKGTATEVTEGLADLRNFLTTSPLSSAVHSAHIEKKNK